MTDQILDLSGRDAAQQVKLPDGNLYPLTAADELGVGQLHKILASYRRAQRLMRVDNPTEDDVEQMLAELCGIARQLLPDAPSASVDRLGLPKLERLVQGFLEASPAASEATTRSTGESSSHG